MKCPVCASRSLVLKELEESLSVLECTVCGGYWLQSFRYWQWIREHGPDLPECDVEDSPKLTPPDNRKALLCPECGHILTRRAVGHGVNFNVDRCGNCRGIWFDKDEWEALKSHNLHDDLHSIYSMTWQRGIREAKRRERLQDQIVELLGAEDFAETKRIKTWIESHPKRSEIMAVLKNELL